MISFCINHNLDGLQCETYTRVRTEETPMFTQSKWPSSVFLALKWFYESLFFLFINDSCQTLCNKTISLSLFFQQNQQPGSLTNCFITLVDLSKNGIMIR